MRQRFTVLVIYLLMFGSSSGLYSAHAADLQTELEQGNALAIEERIKQGLSVNTPQVWQDPLLGIVSGPLLIWAAGQGKWSTLRLLIEKNAPVDAPLQTGETALSLAAREGHIDLVKFLLENRPDLSTQLESQFLLHRVAAEGHLPLLQMLTDKGVSLKSREASGQTPLMVAASNNQIEVLEYLFNQGLEVNETTSDGATALMKAAYNGQIEAVKFLLKHGADPHLRKRDGSTALSWAQRQGQTEIVELLKSR